MQLLLQRRQGKNWIGLSIFKLWAKFDLTSEETALIEKYQVQGYVLSEGNFRRDFLKALLWTIPIALILIPITIPLMGSFVGPRLAPFLFLLILWLLYNQIREQIKISDMLNGRFFSCRSVIRLAAKEQMITNYAVIFIRFLEAMKTWGGQEIIEFDPQNLPMVHLIE